MTCIKAVRISPENFSRYGKVVMTPVGKPTSEGMDYKFWSDIADYHIEGKTEIGLCTVYRQPSTVVSMVERHMNTPEFLVPVDAPLVLPVVTEPSADGHLEAFQVNPGEAVVIDKGIWHAACIPVGREACTYFVVFRKNTPWEDVSKKEIRAHAVEIDLMKQSTS